MNKKLTAVAIAAALSIGTIASATTAQADRGRVKGVPSQVATVISGLVSKGTLTQAQADALTAALTAAAPVRPSIPKDHAAKVAVITSTLGITEADLRAAHVAGKSLATLAGDKKAALITALVNFKSSQIDAAVTAGILTAAQATTAKANLTSRVTARVEAVPTPKVKGMGKGKKMQGPEVGKAPGTATSSFRNSAARMSVI